MRRVKKTRRPTDRELVRALGHRVRRLERLVLKMTGTMSFHGMWIQRVEEKALENDPVVGG